jgi:hypothetical protein
MISYLEAKVDPLVNLSGVNSRVRVGKSEILSDDGRGVAHLPQKLLPSFLLGKRIATKEERVKLWNFGGRISIIYG